MDILGSILSGVDLHSPATWFTILYAIARAGSHVFPDNTIAYKVAAWILGHVKPTPSGGSVASISGDAG